MKSSPAFSIGTGSRGFDLKVESYYYNPGPGAYQPKDFKAKTMPSWRIGTASRDNLHKEMTPGPGAYNSPGKISRSAPKYPMGMKTSLSMQNITPGPGTYNPNTLRGYDRRPPSYTLRGKPGTSGLDRTPGPGAYDHESRILSRSQPAFRIGSAKRDEMARSEMTPGPGTYSTRPQSAYGAFSGPKFPFGTGMRGKDPVQDMAKTLPGPGAYSMTSEFESPGKGTTLVPRRPDSAHTALGRNPGPGAYNPDYLPKTRAPTYRIGTASRDGLGDRRGAPGPGNYDPSLPRTRKSIIIGTSRRRALSEASITPGPGAYNTFSKIDGPKHVLVSRKEDQTKSRNDKLIPGPGTYSPSVEFVKKGNPVIGIGTSSRDDFTKGVKNPGPGTYNVRGSFEGPKWGFPTSPKNEGFRSVTSPGPGTYNIRSSFADVPKYAFGGMPLKIHL